MLRLIDMPSLYLQTIQLPGPLDAAARHTSSAAILPVLIRFSPSASPPGSSCILRAFHESSSSKCSPSDELVDSGWTPEKLHGKD